MIRRASALCCTKGKGLLLPALFLAAGELVLLTYYLVPGAPDGPDAKWKVSLFCLIGVSAAIAVPVGIARNRPTRPLGWYLVAVNEIVYAAADLTYYIRHDLLGLDQFPSVSELLYLLHYPFLIAAALIFIRRRSPGNDHSALVDAGILATTAAMLSWIFVIEPSATTPGENLLSRMTSAAFPVLDLAMLAGAMWLLVGPGRRSRSTWLLGSALMLLFATDTIYALQLLHGTYHTGSFLDGMWATYYLLIGATALDPSMADLGTPSPAGPSGLSARRYIGLGVAAIAVPAILLIEQGRNTRYVLIVVAAGTAVLFWLVIIRLSSSLRRERDMAITDALTGLKNRRFFEAHLEVESARSSRSGKPVSLVLLDIDHFKSVNDGFGHPVGDRVLIETAARLAREVRAGDVLARYGGEEFAVLLAGATSEEAATAASRMMAAVNGTAFCPEPGTQITVTTSAGIVTYPDHVSTTGELVSGADRALYAAKGAGRARLVVGRSDPLPKWLRSNRTEPVTDYLEALADRVDGYQAPVEHASAIARWAVAMAAELGLDEAAQLRCNLAGRLHDIGMLGVPERVLAKTGPLDPDDWAILQDHPVRGELMLSCAPGMGDVAEIVGQLHERADGTGYPRGLREHELRVESKILCVCDAFASMRAVRPHRRALTQDQAIGRLTEARGTQLAAGFVDLFLDLLSRQVVGSLGYISGASHAGTAEGTDRAGELTRA
ncbi:MAG TPA: diguanylate cyclase [Acidimicrobiales bacterium]|nr:diguanylate cyclase [Acidimicrobiales bacterium]